jgi:hypothetical protein
VPGLIPQVAIATRKAFTAVLLVVVTSVAAARAADLVDHPQNLPRPSTPDAVVGDFDGDGHQDLIVINTSVPPTPPDCSGGPIPTADCDPSTLVRVLLGDGPMTFRPGPQGPAGCDARFMAAADFDRDGTLDVVAVSLGYQGHLGTCVRPHLVLFRGDGAGGFRQRVVYAMGNPPVDLAVGDVNEDGAPDMMTVAGFGSLSVFLVNPQGQISEPVVTPPNGADAARLALGDVDGDGHLDAVTSSPSARSMVVFHGDGAGGFALQQVCPLNPGAGRPGGVVIADLDGDGPPEIVVAGAGPGGLPPGSLDRFRRDPSGSFCAPGTRLTKEIAGEIFTSVAAADFDGDGRIDIAASGESPGAPPQGGTAFVRVFPNDGSGWINASQVTPLWEGAHRLTVGDLNADSRPDLVAAGRINSLTFAGHAHVLLNGVPAPPIVRVAMATQPDRVTWADAGADSYDVIIGSLLDLAASNGRFDVGSVTCLANDLGALETSAGPSDPPSGDGWFYLVRGNTPAGGTYDSGGRAQIGHRDQEIAAGSFACP